MDIKTLLLLAVLVTSVYGFALLLYSTQQKTFDGFGLWIASLFVFSLGYLALFLRGTIPLHFSIIIGNFCFALGALLRLDGTIRFTRGENLKTPFYLILAPVIISIAYFHYIVENIVARTLLIGNFTLILCVCITVSFFSPSTSTSKRFFHIAGFLTGSMGIFLLVTPLLLKSSADSNIFQMGFRYAVYYMVILAFEICWGYCLLLLNGQRLEDELRVTEKELRAANLQLEKEMKERITLSGLLPICSHCKKIRDDKGYWNHLESYIETHSEADFSHSICPDCAHELYPELGLKDENKD